MSSSIPSPRSRLVAAAVTLAIAYSVGDTVSAAEDDSLAEVVVTGSRIVRKDYESQSPLVTVGAETLKDRSSVGIEATLNQLPQFTTAGTASSLSAASTPFPSATSAPGAATANLRGLGTNRNLVLVDGRRLQPVNGTLTVDLNTIPSSAISRIEVITGGGASTYGADAISGVVNLILKKNFEGVEFGAQYGITQEGDGQEIQADALFGTNFSEGRGNVMLGINYSERQTILSQDRSWYMDGIRDPNTQPGSLNSSNLSQMTVITGNAPTLFPLRTGGAYTVDQNGHVFDSANPLSTTHPYTGPIGGDSGYKIGPDGFLGFDDYKHSYQQLPLERYALFGSANFKVNDNVEVFSDVHYSQTKTVARGFTSQLFNIWSPTVPYTQSSDDPDSPTFGTVVPQPGGTGTFHPVPREWADLLNSRPNPTAPCANSPIGSSPISSPANLAPSSGPGCWTYVGGIDYFPNYETDTTSNVFQIVAGARGSLPWESWTWEAYGSHGNSTINAQQPEGFPYLPRMQNLFSATNYGKGYAVAYPVTVVGNCTSGLPIFSANGSVDNTPTTSQDCQDYAILRMNSISELQQEVLEATVQGELFNLPAGAVQAAFGADYRSEHFKFAPDAAYNANQDFPNVVQNIALPVGVDGQTWVTEAYAEFAIPVLKDLPGIKLLEIDPGVRYSNYNSAAGDVMTFKIMGTLEVVDEVRFRGGYQRANRAPNVAELFTPRGVGSEFGVGPDPCRNTPSVTPTWGNTTANPNRINMQTLCQYLMTRDGAPASLYVPGQPSANNYNFNVFGATFPFPFDLKVTEGNRALESEQADTTTIGVVLKSPFESPFLNRLTLSIDYWKIDISGAIGTPLHNVVYQQCLDAQYNPGIGDAAGAHSGAELAAGNPFCDLIQREYIAGTPNVYGADRRYKASYINQGGIKTDGIDLQLDWAWQVGSLFGNAGRLGLNVQTTFLNSYALSPFPGAPFQEYAGTTVNNSFDYKVFSTVNYTSGPVSLGLRWQHLPGLDPDPTSSAGALAVDSHDQFDLFGRYTFNSKYELRAGIDNLMNADPEVVGATAVNANKSATSPVYDTFGRRFYVAFRVTL